MTARVLLGEDLVGYLAPAGNVVTFTFDETYLARPDRPVLSQAFEDLLPGCEVGQPLGNEHCAHLSPLPLDELVTISFLRKLVAGTRSVPPGRQLFAQTYGSDATANHEFLIAVGSTGVTSTAQCA